MSRFFGVSLLVQLLLIAGFLWLGWQADQAMDKSGIGDLEAWRRFDSFAGIAFYCFALLWLVTIFLSVVGRAFHTSRAQLAIGLPPLFLVLGWSLSWMI